MNDVALLIPVYGKPEVTGSCLDSLFRSISAEAGITTIVIDDGSDGATKSIIEQHPVQMLTNDRNRGYVYSINRGIEHALQETSAEYIALMNNDLVFEPGWLESLLEQVDIYDIVGFFGRTSVTHGGHMPVSYLEFSCALVKRVVFEQIGIIETAFKSGYYSDDDFCLRALLEGYRIGQVSKGDPPKIQHLHGQTAGSERRWDHMKAEYPVFVNRWSAHRHNPIVDRYLASTLFNPFSGCSGDRDTRRGLIPKLLARLSPRRRPDVR